MLTFTRLPSEFMEKTTAEKTRIIADMIYQLLNIEKFTELSVEARMLYIEILRRVGEGEVKIFGREFFLELSIEDIKVERCTIFGGAFRQTRQIRSYGIVRLRHLLSLRKDIPDGS